MEKEREENRSPLTSKLVDFMDWIQNKRPICLEFKAQLKEQRTKDKINQNKGVQNEKTNNFAAARFVVAVQWRRTTSIFVCFSINSQ